MVGNTSINIRIKILCSIFVVREATLLASPIAAPVVQEFSMQVWINPNAQPYQSRF
jgi:hypothetical protein